MGLTKPTKASASSTGVSMIYVASSLVLVDISAYSNTIVDFDVTISNQIVSFFGNIDENTEMVVFIPISCFGNTHKTPFMFTPTKVIVSGDNVGSVTIKGALYNSVDIGSTPSPTDSENIEYGVNLHGYFIVAKKGVFVESEDTSTPPS